MNKPYQQQNEDIGVCTAVYGNAVAEGIGTHYSYTLVHTICEAAQP